MFKIFNDDVAVDTSKITALYVDNIGTKGKYTYSVKACMDSGDDWTLAEFVNDEEAAKNYLKKFIDELNMAEILKNTK